MLNNNYSHSFLKLGSCPKYYLISQPDGLIIITIEMINTMSNIFYNSSWIYAISLIGDFYCASSYRDMATTRGG